VTVPKPSTTWEWAKRKKLPGLDGPRSLPGGSRSAKTLRGRNRRKPLAVRFWYSGGPDSSWVFQYRGVSWRFPGWVCLEDVGAWMNGEYLEEM
jgi:hypothetical protein